MDLDKITEMLIPIKHIKHTFLAECRVSTIFDKTKCLYETAIVFDKSGGETPDRVYVVHITGAKWNALLKHWRVARQLKAGQHEFLCVGYTGNKRNVDGNLYLSTPSLVDITQTPKKEGKVVKLHEK